MRKTDDVDVVVNDTRDPRSGDDRVMVIAFSRAIGDQDFTTIAITQKKTESRADCDVMFDRMESAS
jgi:hypothetical protein